MPACTGTGTTKACSFVHSIVALRDALYIGIYNGREPALSLAGQPMEVYSGSLSLPWVSHFKENAVKLIFLYSSHS